eukprot:15431092-Alexandrium_andersonii.AAC.1
MAALSAAMPSVVVCFSSQAAVPRASASRKPVAGSASLCHRRSERAVQRRSKPQSPRHDWCMKRKARAPVCLRASEWFPARGSLLAAGAILFAAAVLS